MSFERPQSGDSADPAGQQGHEAPRYGVRLPDENGGGHNDAGAQQQPSAPQQPPAYQPTGAGQMPVNATPYQQQPYMGTPETPKRGLAIAGIVLGALSIVLCWLGLPIVLAIVGLILSIVAFVAAKKVPQSKKTLSIVGLILNIIGLVLCGIFIAILAWVWGVTQSVLDTPEAQQCVQDYEAGRLSYGEYQDCMTEVSSEIHSNDG